jgi:hypothetical protein
MADFTITVQYSGGGVSVDQPLLQVPYDPGVEQTIKWIPEAGATFALKQLIFLRPVGTGHPISVPTPGGDGSIEVKDDNSNPFAQADRFKYLVLIEQNGVVIPSPDPEILNEPSGGAMDDDDEEDGNGRGKGKGGG